MRTKKLMIRRWMMLTITVFIVFLLNTFIVLTAFSKESFTVTDIAGNTVNIDEKGRYLATSDIIFTFSGIREPEAKEDRNRNWIFCEKEVIDGREIYTPVHESFRLDVKEDRELDFIWLDRISGETERDKSLPFGFSVLYKGSEESLPLSELSFEKIGGEEEVILSGKAPVLRIESPAELRSYLYVNKNGEEQKKEIEGKTAEFVFEEGEYDLSLTAVDGWGIETRVPMDIEHFIYDNSSPEIKDVSVKSSGEKSMRNGESFLSKGAVVITPEAEDHLSGTDHFIFHVVNSINKSEYEAYGDSLQLSPCFEGVVSIRSSDRAGNISDELICPRILIDDSGPVLKNRVFKAENKGRMGLRLLFDAGDSLSGLGKLSLFLNGELLEEREFKGEKTGGIESKVKTEKLKDGKNSLKLEATDILGNRSSYDFNLDKEEKKEKIRDNESGFDETPEMFLRGFSNFQKTEGKVRIEAGISNSFPDEGRVYIERHDMDGELASVYESEPGEIEISDEGNYVVHYEIEDRGNIYEEYGYFTIDRSSPVVDSLKDIDRKTFNYFSVDSDPLSSIEDYTYVNGRMTLSGREYDGHGIREPGKYILKISATDELGHSTEESAEFLIVSNKKGSSVSLNTLSENAVNNKKSEGKKKVKQVSAGEIYLIKEEKQERGISENHAGPSKSGRERTIYRREITIIPIILIAALFLLIAGMLILIVGPVMERNSRE